MSDFVWVTALVVGVLLALFGFTLLGDKLIKRKKTLQQEAPIESAGIQIATATMADLKRWNWGAFFLTWVVGVFLFAHIVEGVSRSSGHAAALFPLIVIALLVLTLTVSILLGLKGNASFWKGKKWKSVDAFHKNQRKWAVIGGILFLIYVGGNAFHAWLSFSFTWRPIYQSTASLLRQNFEIQNLLGTPIRTYLPTNFHRETGLTVFNYRASGPQASGMATVWATGLNNSMKHNKVEFEFDGVQNKKIVVYP